MGRNMVNEESYIPMIEWINQEDHDFFWLEKLREAFGCPISEDGQNPQISIIKHFIAMLRTNGVIQCTDVRKGRRQYHRVRIVTIEDVRRQ